MPATRIIRQSVTFQASPHEVYELLMDERRHQAFTGQPAKIRRRVGGIFSVYGDYAQGKNLELVTDRKIVQSWQASDWPTDVMSTVTFTLKPVAGGTRLTFRQEGVPAEFVTDVAKGWKNFYWTPMKATLNKK